VVLRERARCAKLGRASLTHHRAGSAPRPISPPSSPPATSPGPGSNRRRPSAPARYGRASTSMVTALPAGALAGRFGGGELLRLPGA